MLWLGRDKRRRIAEQIKAVKWRQWVLLPSIPVTIAALVINTIVIINALESFANYSNDDTGNFSFYDIPEGLIRSKTITAVSLEVVLLAIPTMDRDDLFRHFLSPRRLRTPAMRYPSKSLSRAYRVCGGDESRR
ncbi:hypothetical protein GQX73_g1214 [Xylaria multiplex]|uniref:Uncharacterized protein n=1 Tax=Xylaria multiplex TaxID=323545 RepID=A0A7C8MZS5_9PEZI|nr:hypothetical protein GQX73_g1214 [Xylaria multiplex]